MADLDTRPELEFEEMKEAPRSNLPALPAGTGMTQVSTKIFTARRVEMKRDIIEVKNRIQQYAAAFGDAYVYAWNTKNADGTSGRVQGVTINGAMQLLSLYGNAVVNISVDETPTHYLFDATFSDLETGANFNRLFRQRKSQNIGGRMDAERKEDIVFQIGQSKAERNVIINGIPALARFMEEEAVKSVVQRVKADPKAARDWVMNEINNVMKLDLRRVERYLTRPQDRWTDNDVAALITAINTIGNGMAHVDDVFPPIDLEEKLTDAKAAGNQQKVEEKKPAGDKDGARPRQSRAKAEDKPAQNQAEQNQAPQGQQPKDAAPAADAGKKPDKPKDAPKQEQQNQAPPTPSDADLLSTAGDGGDEGSDDDWMPGDK